MGQLACYTSRENNIVAENQWLEANISFWDGFFFHGFRLVEGGLLKGTLGMYKCIFQTYSASYH